MSVSGITSYQSIAPYKLYLNVANPEKDFNAKTDETNTDLNLGKDLKTDCWSKNNVIMKLTDDPRFVIFVNAIIKNKFEKAICNESITLFVPISDIRNDLDYDFFSSTVLLNHMVDGIIEPDEIVNQKVELRMMSGSRLKMNNLVITDDTISKVKNRITEIIDCGDNRYIYVIDRPIKLNVL